MVTRRPWRVRLLDGFIDWIVIRGSILAAASGLSLLGDAIWQSVGGR